MENLNISGVFSNGGGVYNDVSISGSGKLNGDTTCKAFRCAGASKVEGNLHCESFSCSGATKITGDVDCAGMLKTSGSVGIGGKIHAGEVRISGAVSCADISAEKSIVTSGIIKSEGGMSAEEISASGTMNVKGLVNAERFTLSLGGNNESRVGAVGGAVITVKRKREDENSFINTIVNAIFVNRETVSRFACDIIEGDVIDVEYTHANVVRGNDINIGDGCVIGRVEYTGKVTYSESSKIGELAEI